MPNTQFMSMANKKLKTDDQTGDKTPVFFFCLQRLLLICCVSLLSTDMTSAQKLSKFYVSSSHPSGILYFVLPQTYFRNPDTKTDFVIDITYLDHKDSATVNFTYTDRESISLESITIAYDNWLYKTTVKRIYIDMAKSRWHYRYTFDIPFEKLPLFYRSKNPTITIKTNSERTITLQTVRRWRRNSEINNRIVQIIQKNKESIAVK